MQCVASPLRQSTDLRPASLLMACIGLLFIACGGNPAGSSGLAPVPGCDGPGLSLARGYGADARLIAGYDLTAAQLVAWHERPAADRPRVSDSPWRRYPPNEHVAFCYYDGTFTNLEKRPLGASAAASPYERILVIVDPEGEAHLFSGGRPNNTPLEDPRN